MIVYFITSCIKSFTFVQGCFLLSENFKIEMEEEDKKVPEIQVTNELGQLNEQKTTIKEGSDYYFL